MKNYKFGRLEPKDRQYEIKYGIRTLNLETVRSAEVLLPITDVIRNTYNQKESNACVGYSASIMQSMKNTKQLYDATWLYNQSKLYDGDPRTVIEVDEGAYIWAAMFVLNHFGHKKLSETEPHINDGILSYYWGSTIDDIRTSMKLYRKPVVLGIPWYEEFMTPKKYKAEYWIGKNSNLGRSLGGHAICVSGVSDSKQAVQLSNSWGLDYPLVWLPFSTLERLMTEGGEMCIVTDRSTIT